MELPASQHLNIELEDVACDLCGARDATPFAQSQDYWHGTSGTFSLVRCRHCSLVYLNPRPTESTIGAFYPSDYYAYAAENAPRLVTLRGRIKRFIRARRLLSAVAAQIPPLKDASRDGLIADDIPEWIVPGAVLDVGCGSGFMLDTMADMGWTTFGIEPDEAAADRARRRGHRVFCQSATQPMPEALQFDLILVSHTLEHVYSPRHTLNSLRGLLKPGTGRVVIEVPNAGSLFMDLFQGLGTAFDTPRHLYLYTPDTLERFLVDTGFTIERLRHRSGPNQMIKSLTLVSKLFRIEGARADKVLEDPEVLAAFQPIADLATARRQGGALRVTARCSS